MFEWQKVASDGLLLLLQKNRSYIDENVRRLRLMHQHYVRVNADLYEESALQWLEHYLNSVVHKYYLASISVEQLQVVRHNKINETILPALQNSLDRLDCSDDEQLIVSFALECFLFESRAFLDLYMILVCLLLRTGFARGYMTKERFYNELGRTDQEPFVKKAAWVKVYFDDKVFGEHNDKAFVWSDWGKLLKSLRDRIAHRDIVQPSFDSRETLIHDILLDWPTLQKMTYHSMCEMIRNGMYFLFYDVSAYIYDSEWDAYSKRKAR
jgi:hypothetical protein